MYQSRTGGGMRMGGSLEFVPGSLQERTPPPIPLPPYCNAEPCHAMRFGLRRQASPMLVGRTCITHSQLYCVLRICAGLGHSCHGTCRTVVGRARDLSRNAAALLSDACTPPLSRVLALFACPRSPAGLLAKVRAMDLHSCKSRRPPFRR